MKSGQFHEAENFCMDEYLESRYHQKLKVFCLSLEFPKNSKLRIAGEGDERRIKLKSYATFPQTGEREDVTGRFIVEKISNKWFISGHY